MTHQNCPSLACAILRGTLVLPQLGGRIRLYRRPDGVLVKLYASGLRAEKNSPELFLQILTPQKKTLFRHSISGLHSASAYLSVFSDSFSIYEALESTAEIAAGEKTVLASGIIRGIEGAASEYDTNDTLII